MPNEVLYETENYEVRIIEDALDEDGSSKRKGYGIFNKDTGVLESTGLALAPTKWQAFQFQNLLNQFESHTAAAAGQDVLDALEDPGEDVVLN